MKLAPFRFRSAFFALSLVALLGTGSAALAELLPVEDGAAFPAPALGEVANCVFRDSICSNSRMTLHLRVTTDHPGGNATVAWTVRPRGARSATTHYGEVHVDDSLIRLTSSDEVSSIYLAVNTLLYTGREFSKTQRLSCRFVRNPPPAC